MSVALAFSSSISARNFSTSAWLRAKAAKSTQPFVFAISSNTLAIFSASVNWSHALKKPSRTCLLLFLMVFSAAVKALIFPAFRLCSTSCQAFHVLNTICTTCWADETRFLSMAFIFLTLSFVFFTKECQVCTICALRASPLLAIMRRALVCPSSFELLAIKACFVSWAHWVRQKSMSALSPFAIIRIALALFAAFFSCAAFASVQTLAHPW
mmetsp:Transcript_13675/g.36847  ORF Transcript_13675/g.36847 Transcript_13675/m.36847 type:complete len:212 (+) Transcript_13675:603-1238(+)